MVRREAGFKSRADLSEEMGCWSNRTTPAPHAGNEGARPSRSTHDSGGRKAVIRQPWELETVGSIPTPLTARAHGPTGRHQFGRLEIRVRFPVGPLRKVAGYGWPGRSAKAVLQTGDEGSTPLPSACPDGETENHPMLLTWGSGFESWSGCWEAVASG